MTSWEKVNKKANQITISPNGTVYARQIIGVLNAYYYLQSHSGAIFMAVLYLDTGLSISIGKDETICLISKKMWGKKVLSYKYDGSLNFISEEQTDAFGNKDLLNVSACTDTSDIYLLISGTDDVYTKNTSESEITKNWAIQKSSVKFKKVVCGTNGDIWGQEEISNMIYKKNGINPDATFDKLSDEKFLDIHVSIVGTAWAIGENNEIYSRSGSAWHKHENQNGLHFTKIAAYSTFLYAIDDSSEIWTNFLLRYQKYPNLTEVDYENASKSDQLESLSQDFEKCAAEEEVCDCDGYVGFGPSIDGKFHIKAVQGNISCTKEQFSDVNPASSTLCECLKVQQDNGNTPNQLIIISERSWNQIDGDLEMVKISPNGIGWGYKDSRLFNFPDLHDLSQKWKDDIQFTSGGSASNFSVGFNEIVYWVSSDKTLFYKNNSTNEWITTDDTKVEYQSACKDTEHLWIIINQSIWKKNFVMTKTSVLGDHSFKLIADIRLSKVACGPNNEIWGIDMLSKLAKTRPNENSDWSITSTQLLIDIDVTLKGHVLAIGQDRQVYSRFGLEGTWLKHTNPDNLIFAGIAAHDDFAQANLQNHSIWYKYLEIGQPNKKSVINFLLILKYIGIR